MTKFRLSIFLSFLFCVVSINGEHCNPGAVTNVFLRSASQLEWVAPENPDNCTIKSYLVNIFDPDNGDELQFQSNSLSAFLFGLDTCKVYDFEIHALTDENFIGPVTKMTARVPPPPYVNLTLTDIDVVANDGEIVLTWKPNEDVAICITMYRVVYWDESKNPTDVYVPETSLSFDATLTPCMQYTFQVQAIVDTPDTEGPIAEVVYEHDADVPSAPKLGQLTTTSNSVTMIWHLPTFEEHRCQLTALIVDTIGLSANNNATYFAIEDNQSRPDIEISLEDLEPNTVYVSTVTLENVAGESKAVTVYYQTTEDFVFDFENNLIV